MTQPLTLDRLSQKVDFISKLTGIEFRFVPGTVRGTKGYLMRPLDPSKASPFLQGDIIGRSRHEANRTLDAILAGIGFVGGIPTPEPRRVVL